MSKNFSRIKNILSGSTTMPHGTGGGAAGSSTGNLMGFAHTHEHNHDGSCCGHDHSHDHGHEGHVHDENCKHDH